MVAWDGIYKPAINILFREVLAGKMGLSQSYQIATNA
jgi:hypothetical protein